MRRYYSNETILRSRDDQPLSLEQMQRSLPAIFAADAHESRSSRYVYIPTRDIISKLMGEGFYPVEARVTNSRHLERQSHAKHMIRLRQHGGEIKTRQVGDTHFEVVLRNAHDGTASYDFMGGLFRLACLNGMVVSDGTIASAHVRHSGNHDKQLGQVVDAVYSVVQDAPKVLETTKVWSQIELTKDEQMAMADAARTIRFGDKDGNVQTLIKAEQLLQVRRWDDNRNNLWTTFNRIQENAVRGGLAAAGSRMATREVRGIDADIKLNKALWQLGARMAELKSAA